MKKHDLSKLSHPNPLFRQTNPILSVTLNPRGYFSSFVLPFYYWEVRRYPRVLLQVSKKFAPLSNPYLKVRDTIHRSSVTSVCFLPKAQQQTEEEL